MQQVSSRQVVLAFLVANGIVIFYAFYMNNTSEYVEIRPMLKISNSRFMRKNESHHVPLQLVNKEFEKLVKKSEEKFRRKIILVYTSIFGRGEWYNLPRNKLKNYLRNNKCKYDNCEVTYEKSLFSKADAIIFHERDMPGVETLQKLSKDSNRQNQRWVFFTSENPKHAGQSNLNNYNSFFNWTMTYKLNSDIHLPYQGHKKLNDQDKRPDPNINYAKGKTRKIVWFVSNCNFDIRNNLVHTLEKLIDVDVGGGCRNSYKRKVHCPRSRQDCSHDYKFYLGLENGICTDYITEKYWNNLEQGLLPIVAGGGNYSDPRLAIPGSYIDALSFDSVEQLANHIRYLDKNDTAYNEYFKWKQHYKIWKIPDGWPFENYFSCKLCEMLGQDLPKKVYHKFPDFYDRYNDCYRNEEIVRKKLKSMDGKTR